MHAYVEWWCEHGGMVRVGPDAHELPDPYIFSVGVKVTGEPGAQRATLAGTHKPEGGITAAMSTAIRVLFRRLKIPLRMERRRPGRPVCEVCDHKLD